VLSRVFRGKFVDGLEKSHSQLTLSGALHPLRQPPAFASFLRTLFRQNWVVYLKPPFGGPQYVLRYLAGYTHRVAISNHRLVAFEHDKVTFRYKDYAHGKKKRLMTLPSQEFLRRFLLHVLPRGFVRIRFYGFLAHRRRANLLPLCQQLLLHHPKPIPSPAAESTAVPLTGFRCPHCDTLMPIVETFSASTFAPTAPRSTLLDSS
jgi:hypothetical protein